MRTFTVQRIFGFAIILALLFSSIHPALVLADGETPVVETTLENTLNGEATEEIQATEIIEESAENGGQEPTEVGTDVPAETTEVVEKTRAALEETPMPEISGNEEELGTQAETEEATEENSPTPDPDEELTDILEAAAEADLTFVDEGGDLLIMASEEASEAIGSSGDPSGTLGVARDIASIGDSFEYYRATGMSGQQDGDCTYDSGTHTLTCYFTNVLSQAVTDAANGSTILIEADTYNETVTVDKTLVLSGGSGGVYVDSIILLTGASITGSTNIFASSVEVNAGASIQDGIDVAASGATVNVSGDKFTEDIEIVDKDITLRGTSGTVIQSPLTIASKFITGTSTENRPIIYVNNANATIDSITVDGANQGSTNKKFSGIAFYNAGGTVSNSTIINIMDSAFSGAQHGVAIYAYNVNGFSRTLTIFNNDIYDFQKNAMALSGDGLTVDVHDNTITGEGYTSVTAQNGIQVSYGATGSVTNNTISEIGYTGAKWGATAILLYDSSGVVDVSGNNIFNVENGINTSNGSAMNVHDNLIYNSDWAISVDTNIYDPSTWTPSGYYYPATDSQIYGNTLLNNYYGYYGTDSSVVLRDNVFSGNVFGVYGEYSDGPGYGLYNYWGCDAGPDGGTGCDSAFGVIYDPWLTDPDGDGVYESSDGTGGYVDNCPTVANADQADSDGDGIGDACEPSLPAATPIPFPPGPAQPVDGIIPVTGGDITRLACPTGSNQVIFELENGNQVRFIDLCNLDALVNTIGESAMPHDLPAGTQYISDLFIQVLEEGTLLDILAGGSAELYFLVPDDVELGNLALYYWDEEAGTWLEIGLYSEDITYPIMLSEDGSNKDRLIYAGLSSLFNRASSTENFTGLFVLASK